VCRASVHDLSGNEYRINGAKTSDWRNPAYDPVGEVSGSCPNPVVTLSGYREVENKRSKKNPAAKPAPGADPRFQPFFAFAFESFSMKHNRKPLWQGKDLNGLKNLLKSQGTESLPLERLQSNWRNFLGSTEAFTVKQGDSLSYFCSNLDKFSDGPILAGKVKPNGDINAAIETTVLGFLNNTQVRH
jgi:hypothetical protein